MPRVVLILSQKQAGVNGSLSQSNSKHGLVLIDLNFDMFDIKNTNP